MFTNKHILASLTLLTYCTTGHAQFVDLRTKQEVVPFGTRKQLPSYELLDRMALPDYQPNEADEKQLVNIFAPFKKDERPFEDLPKMILAASAWLTLFEATKEDRQTTMNDISEIVEATEDAYHGQCAPDQKELSESNKQEIAKYLYCSPFIYRSENSTLFASTKSKTSLRRQFDEFNQRLLDIDGKLKSIETFAKITQKQTAYMSSELRTQVEAHMTIDELQTSLKLAKKILEINQLKTVERMKAVNDIQKDNIEKCECLVTTAQNDFAQAAEETKADAAAALEEAKKQLVEAQTYAKAVRGELDEVNDAGWFSYLGKTFSFSGH